MKKTVREDWSVCDSKTIAAGLRHGVLSLLFLALLAERPMHAYEATQEVKRRSGEKIDIKMSTSYGLFSNLKNMGLVSSYEEPRQGKTPRIFFKITPKGKYYLALGQAEYKTMREGVDLVFASVETGANELMGEETPRAEQ